MNVWYVMNKVIFYVNCKVFFIRTTTFQPLSYSKPPRSLGDSYRRKQKIIAYICHIYNNEQYFAIVQMVLLALLLLYYRGGGLVRVRVWGWLVSLIFSNVVSAFIHVSLHIHFMFRWIVCFEYFAWC